MVGSESLLLVSEIVVVDNSSGWEYIPGQAHNCNQAWWPPLAICSAYSVPPSSLCCHYGQSLHAAQHRICGRMIFGIFRICEPLFVTCKNDTNGAKVLDELEKPRAATRDWTFHARFKCICSETTGITTHIQTVQFKSIN